MKLSKEFIAMFREEAKRAQWEINSWNGKSIDDLVVDYLERKALKPEDFTGAVVLPIDEAKVIFEALLRLPVEGNKAVLKKVLIPLKEKIEQAEIKHLKDEIAQWKEEQERDNYYRYQFLKSMKQAEGK